MTKFRLTYQAVTEESASAGDFAHHGFVSRTGNFNPGKNYFTKRPAEFRLREAVSIFEQHGGNVQANECPVTCPRWFDACNESFDGDFLSVTIGLHIPEQVTPSTRRRIARYLGCYGVR